MGFAPATFGRTAPASPPVSTRFGHKTDPAVTDLLPSRNNAASHHQSIVQSRIAAWRDNILKVGLKGQPAVDIEAVACLECRLGQSTAGRQARGLTELHAR